MCFSYKGGCGIRESTSIEAFKRRAGLGYRYMTPGYYQYYLSYTTKNLKNKVILNLKHIVCIAMWPLVVIRYVCALLCCKNLYCMVWLLISWGSSFCGFH